jgi:hypothetical protein
MLRSQGIPYFTFTCAFIVEARFAEKSSKGELLALEYSLAVTVALRDHST